MIMNITDKIFCILLALVFINISYAKEELEEQNDSNTGLYYQYPAFDPLSGEEHDQLNEIYDPYLELVKLNFTDIVIPGNGGLTLKVERSFMPDSPMDNVIGKSWVIWPYELKQKTYCKGAGASCNPILVLSEGLIKYVARSSAGTKATEGITKDRWVLPDEYKRMILPNGTSHVFHKGETNGKTEDVHGNKIQYLKSKKGKPEKKYITEIKSSEWASCNY